MLRFLIASILLCLTTNSVNAVPRPGLIGIKRVHLVIEQLNSDAKACGITEQLIHDAFMYPASGAKFEVVDQVGLGDQVTPMFYINVNTTRLNPVCASAINMDVRFIQMITSPFSKHSLASRIVLWDESYVGASAPNDHPTQMKNVIEDLTKDFITEWNLSNK
jgi:hypothetical protein